MISQKNRNNATIGYFFLGWMILFAKKNPNFSDQFIQNHAKSATKGHILFLILYIVYSSFLSQFFFHNIPIINLSIDGLIHFCFFVALTLFILRGIYDSQKGGETHDMDNIFSFGYGGTKSFGYESATETDKMMFFLAHIPFLGMIIAKKYENIITTTGAKISSIFTFLYLLHFVKSGFDSFSMILLFIFIFALIFVGVQFFMGNTYTSYTFLTRIPSMDTVYQIVRSLPGYIGEIVQVIREKKEHVSFQNCLQKTNERDTTLLTSFKNDFIENHLSFSPIWIFIPFINFIFISKIISGQKTKYIIAIGQGLIITGIFVIVGFLYSFSSPLLLFLLFPIFYIISHIASNPFQRIPIIYEIYVLINTLTFGLLRNTRKIQKIKAQHKSVKFKV